MLGLFRVGDQELRLAVIDAQPQSIEPEQREQRHVIAPVMHRAEQADIERQRGLEHEGDAVARLDAVRIEPVGELRGSRRRSASKLRISSAAVRMGDAHRRAARAIGVAGDAFVRDVEVLAIAVEQLPQRGRIGMRLGIGIARIVGQLH